jgi:hypothetical protein
VIVRIVVLWIMATFAVVLLAGEAFDHIADDVSVRRAAPMTRTEVAEQLRARLGQGGPPSSTSEPGGQGDGQGDGQTPPSPGTTAGSGPKATTGGPDSTLSTGEGGGGGTAGSGAEPGGAVTSSTTSDQADPAQAQQPAGPSDDALGQSNGP